MTEEQEERFLKKVSIPANVISDCWEWTAGKFGTGYGAFQLNGKACYAHRISYELVNGAIPVRMFLDHSCHNRACVNPSHLRVVTQRQNSSNLKNKSKMSSKYTGVCWHKPTQKWKARIHVNGKHMYLGIFSDEQDASDAYQTALAKFLATGSI